MASATYTVHHSVPGVPAGRTLDAALPTVSQELRQKHADEAGIAFPEQTAVKHPVTPAPANTGSIVDVEYNDRVITANCEGGTTIQIKLQEPLHQNHWSAIVDIANNSAGLDPEDQVEQLLLKLAEVNGIEPDPFASNVAPDLTGLKIIAPEGDPFVLKFDAGVGIILDDSELTNVKLKGNFLKASIINTKWDGVVADQDTRLDLARISGTAENCLMDGCYLRGANLNGFAQKDSGGPNVFRNVILTKEACGETHSVDLRGSWVEKAFLRDSKTILTANTGIVYSPDGILLSPKAFANLRDASTDYGKVVKEYGWGPDGFGEFLKKSGWLTFEIDGKPDLIGVRFSAGEAVIYRKPSFLPRGPYTVEATIPPGLPKDDYTEENILRRFEKRGLRKVPADPAEKEQYDKECSEKLVREKELIKATASASRAAGSYEESYLESAKAKYTQALAALSDQLKKSAESVSPAGVPIRPSEGKFKEAFEKQKTTLTKIAGRCDQLLNPEWDAPFPGTERADVVDRLSRIRKDIEVGEKSAALLTSQDDLRKGLGEGMTPPTPAEAEEVTKIVSRHSETLNAMSEIVLRVERANLPDQLRGYGRLTAAHSHIWRKDGLPAAYSETLKRINTELALNHSLELETKRDRLAGAVSVMERKRSAIEQEMGDVQRDIKLRAQSEIGRVLNPDGLTPPPHDKLHRLLSSRLNGAFRNTKALNELAGVLDGLSNVTDPRGVQAQLAAWNSGAYPDDELLQGLRMLSTVQSSVRKAA